MVLKRAGHIPLLFFCARKSYLQKVSKYNKNPRLRRGLISKASCQICRTSAPSEWARLHLAFCPCAFPLQRNRADGAAKTSSCICPCAFPLQRNRADGASAGASAALNAFGRVNGAFAVLFGNGADRAGRFTGAAVNADFGIHFISHKFTFS